jgi:hypothetical protein
VVTGLSFAYVIWCFSSVPRIFVTTSSASNCLGVRIPILFFCAHIAALKTESDECSLAKKTESLSSVQRPRPHSYQICTRELLFSCSTHHGCTAARSVPPTLHLHASSHSQHPRHWQKKNILNNAANYTITVYYTLASSCGDLFRQGNENELLCWCIGEGDISLTLPLSFSFFLGFALACLAHLSSVWSLFFCLLPIEDSFVYK